MSNIVIRGIDVVSLISSIRKLNKVNQAKMLSELEAVIGKDSKQFSQIRKILLDGTNDYTRSVVKTIFGDIDV